jgi:hypothetical protein
MFKYVDENHFTQKGICLKLTKQEIGKNPKLFEILSAYSHVRERGSTEYPIEYFTKTFYRLNNWTFTKTKDPKKEVVRFVPSLTNKDFLYNSVHSLDIPEDEVWFFIPMLRRIFEDLMNLLEKENFTDLIEKLRTMETKFYIQQYREANCLLYPLEDEEGIFDYDEIVKSNYLQTATKNKIPEITIQYT